MAGRPPHTERSSARRLVLGVAAVAFAGVLAGCHVGPGLGWAIYSLNADPGFSPSVVPAMDKKPTMIRWYVEMDRCLQGGPGAVSWSAYAPFFQKVKETGARLDITIGVWGQCWNGTAQNSLCVESSGLVKNGWASDVYNNWFKEPATTPYSYKVFVEGLVTAVLAYVPADHLTVGPFNEPDQRWGPQGTQENFPNPWRNWYQLNNARWTGGTAKMVELYDIVAEVLARKTGGAAKVASGGLQFSGWIAPLAAKTQVVDLHAYMKPDGDDTVEQATAPDEQYLLGVVATFLARWDAVRPGLPFFLGEAGTFGYPTRQPSTAEAALLRDIDAQLRQTYGGRYLGMAFHGGMPAFTGSKAWWDPTYTSP